MGTIAACHDVTGAIRTVRRIDFRAQETGGRLTRVRPSLVNHGTENGQSRRTPTGSSNRPFLIVENKVATSA